jgi:hypothetical protein
MKTAFNKFHSLQTVTTFLLQYKEQLVNTAQEKMATYSENHEKFINIMTGLK